MKKKLLLLGGLIASMMLCSPVKAFAETTTVNVLAKGADGAFNMKYQYSTRNGDETWPECPGGADWYTTSYDDSGWSEKKVPFGSDLSGDQKWSGEYNCYWLRKNVDFGTIDANAQYYIITKHDDTYKLYVNGTLIVDRQGWTGGNYNWVAIDGSLLHDSNNLIAVYIQQNYGGAYFDFGVKKVNYDLSSPYAGVEPENGKDFYLYNPKSGLWLQNNDRITSDWNTHGELGIRGINFTLNYVENAGGNNNGGYYLNGHFSRTTLNAGNRYLDTDAKDAWHLSKVNVPGIDNAYTLIYYPTDQDDYILSSKDDSGRANKSNNLFTPAGNNYFLDTYRSQVGEQSVWVLVTKEQRLAKMVTGSQANPQDATWLIQNADLADVDDRRDAWSKENDEGDVKYECRGDWDDSRNGRIYEFFNNKSFTIKQTIKDLPAGKYKMTVQGFYRGGEAKMFAGDASKALLSSDTNDNNWTVARAMYNNGAYIGEPMEFTHNGGDLTIGVKKESKIGDTDWVVISKFKLEYIGGNYAKLEEAYNYMVERGYNDATANDLLTNAKPVTESDVNALKVRFKQHVADKSVQPTIFTDMQAATIGDQNHNDYSKAVDNLADGFYLYNVGTGRWFCGGADWGAHAAVGFPGIKVTTPRNDYKLNESEVGRYNSIKTYLFNGNWNDGGLLNHSGYCDTGGNGWKFWTKDAGQGIYTIAKNGSNTGNNESNGYGTKELLGFNANTIMEAVTNKVGADDPNNQWIFVTEAQRDQMAQAAMATASSSNPVDMTWKIKMPGFNQRERKEGSNQSVDELPWVCNHDNYRYSNNNGRHIINDRGQNHNDFCVDIYGAKYYDQEGNLTDDPWVGGFSLKQTITGLTPGKYRVKVQGYNNGGSDENKAKLVANGKDKVLQNRGDETALPWQNYANTTWEAIEYFQNGLYWNDVVCYVGNDGELTLGVESPSITDGHVVLFDNFRLEYIGAYVELDESIENNVTNVTADVTLNRKIKADVWNTFCVPFAMDKPAGWTVKELTGVDVNGENYSMTFGDAASIVAGKPYMVKVENAVEEPLFFENKTISATMQPTEFNGLTFQGVYNSGNAPEGSFIISNNKFYNVNSTVALKAFRGYITVGGASARSISFIMDDEVVTGIEGLNAEADEAETIYNLAGQRIQKMQKGVNVVNGKKVLF